ncbi:MAG TPA: hypothetical protein VK121_01560 [Pseudogracilibacillus sp.]|nr:hypothetical protein [Pseudogracilibacillus sp.]
MTIKNILKSEVAPLFNPEEGKTIIEPLGNEKGYWVGAPTILYDKENKTFYLYYRIRQPRGHGEDERGFEVRIAKSKDGENFKTIWSLHKKELNSSSIERSSLVKVKNDLYRLYISYVDPKDNRWRIDVVEASDPALFDVKTKKNVLSASSDLGLKHLEGVKDPYVFKQNDTYFMYFVYAQATGDDLSNKMHETGDVHNTGLAKASTGIATSEDGVNFEWSNTAIPVGNTGWDQYQSRLTTIIPYGNGYTAIWDGSIGVEQNYEEKAAVGITYDLKTFAKVSFDGPVLETEKQKAVRYVDALIHEGSIWYYYEYTREDDAHELRLVKTHLN